MAEKLTPQQLQVVHDRGGKLLVSAAAGSGKTKVLVDRLLEYLTDPVSPANIDEFLIITYTKAAAAELRGKIASKLSERIAEDPSNRHLQNQLQRLYLAKISTVHSFCGDILREYAYLLDLSADFRIGDENECLQLQVLTLERLMESVYGSLDQDAELQTFIDSQGLGRNDAQIPNIILKVHASAQCHLNPEQWLDTCISATYVEGLDDVSQTSWGKYLIDDLHRSLDRHIAAMACCADSAAGSAGMEKPAALLADTVSQLNRLRSCQTWDDIVNNSSLEYGRLTFGKSVTDTHLAAQIKEIRGNCKKQLEKKLRAFCDPSARLLEDLEQTNSAAKGLIKLVRAFDKEYRRLKKARRVLDFSDLEHKMLDLLLGTKRTGITNLAKEIGLRFREVMVDEYQDSNEVQDAIFSTLTQQRQNCFMVGDVKQSIYQFRLADPNIFIEKYNSYAHAENAVQGQGRKVLLSSNFRSSGGVIEAVNAVFAGCMSPDVGGIAYGKDEMLYEGIPHIPLDEPEVELYGIEVQEDTYAEEAAFVADRICQLLDGQHYVRDADTLRPITPDDIVILLRSPGSVGGEFVYALENRGIRCTSPGNTDLLQTEEVSFLRSFLQIISNPIQDIPLLAVLTNRVFGFNAEDIAQMRSQSRYSDLYSALSRWDHDGAKAFLKLLDQLRLESRMNDLPTLLQRILSCTKIESIYAGMFDGEQRLDNLHNFCQIAFEYDSAGHKGVDLFLEHLDAMDEKGLVVAQSQQKGSVTIMSIHKSKGLEFPVVFLCGLSRSFNQESAYAQVLCDKDLGLGLSFVDTKQRVRYPTVSKRAIATKILTQSISEEMRVLYVAMTRAKDRLIMTYAVKNLEADLSELAMRMNMSGSDLVCSEVDCPGTWILYTALKRTEAGAFFALGGNPGCATVQETPWSIQVVSANTNDAVYLEEEEKRTEVVDLDSLQKKLCFRYPYKEATLTPSKRTATQLKGRSKDQEATENAEQAYLPVKQFRKPQLGFKSLSGIQKGNAYHTFMQYVDFSACKRMDSIEDEIARLINRHLLTKEQATLIDRNRVLALFDSEIGKRVLSCDTVLREFKFSILDDASKHYEDIGEEKILLQGVIDCALIEDDGLTIIDFKTDYVTEETLQQVCDRYRQQVRIYADALSRIYNLPVKAAMLYFFQMNTFVTL